MTTTSAQQALFNYVQGLFPKPVYLVGGAVRDIALGIVPKDYDFASAMTTEEVKAALKGKHRAYLIGERHGTVGFKVGDEMVEITTFRTETYESGSRQPYVTFTTDITLDLGRRDFTVNAMALRCGNLKLLDPYGGMVDLETKIIRTVGNSKLRFKEDPLRILRAIRIAAKYGLNIEAKTADRVEKMAPKLLEISKERWVQELDKILLLPPKDAYRGLTMLWQYRVFTYILPEIQLQYNYEQNSYYHDFYLHVHTALVVSHVPEDLDMRWAALLHDVAKPFVRTEHPKGHSNYINHELLGAEMVDSIFRRLKMSNARRETVKELVLNHLKSSSVLKPYDDANKKLQ